MKLIPFLRAAGLLSITFGASVPWAQGFDITESGTITITITTEVSPSGAGYVIGSGSVVSNSNATLTAKANAGYGFLSWTVGASNGAVLGTNSQITFQAASNWTIVANFGFLVTTASSPTNGGTTSGGSIYTNGATVTVEAVPTDCHSFVRWTKGTRTVTTNENYTFTVGGPEALTAVFHENSYQNQTFSSPPSGGTIRGGGTAACGAKVTLKAIPARDFNFVGWSIGGALVGTNTNSALTIITASNQTYTSYFEDTQPPQIAISSYFVAGSVLMVNGTTKDRSPVDSVLYALNASPRGGSVAGTTNGFTNWTATALLPTGINEFQALAEDAYQNVSLTTNFDVSTPETGLAPVSLAGLVLQITPNNQGPQGQGIDPLTVAFGRATFAQITHDTNAGSAGDYAYVQTSPDTAQLAISTFAPPSRSGGNVIVLTFTSPDAGTFTNEGSVSGTFTASAGTGLPLTTVDGRNSVTVDSSSNVTNFTQFKFDKFTSTNSLGSNVVGSFTFTEVAPGAALLVEIWTNTSTTNIFTNYVLNQFTSIGKTSSGNYYSTVFSTGSAGSPSYSFGTFSSTNRPTKRVPLAPDTLAGWTEKFTSGGVNYSVNFGEATLGLTTSSANATSGVANYAYVRAANNQAYVILNYIAPPQATNHNGTNLVSFLTDSTALYVGVAGDGGLTSSGTQLSLSAPSTTPLAPYTLSGKTIVFTSRTGSTTKVLGTDGTFNSGSGTYTFTQYSPDVVMATFTDISGDTTYAQLAFSSATKGSFFTTQINSSSQSKTEVGTFVLQ